MPSSTEALLRDAAQALAAKDYKKAHAACLDALKLDPALPAMKAIGVRELTSVLENRSSLEDAINLAKTATRQYAKRQMTWFRNQLGDGWKILNHSDGGDA